MENTVRIIVLVALSLALGVVVALLILVLIEHRAERKQNKLYTNTQRQQMYSPAVDPKKVNDFLVGIKVKDDEIQGHIKLYRMEFEIAKKANAPLSDDFVGRLDWLDHDIYWRREADDAWDEHLSNDERQIIAGYHADWKKIRDEIRSMATWRPLAK